MLEKGGILLLKARNKAGLTREEVYRATHISESNLARWEKGETSPSLDNLYALALTYHDKTLWPAYLWLTEPSYREYHSLPSDARNMLAGVVSIGKELADVMSLQDRVERDMIDGKIDDPATMAEYIRQVREARDAQDAFLLQYDMEGAGT